MRKHLKVPILILLVAVIAIGSVFLGRYIYNHADHAAGLDTPEIADYNTAITAAARKAGKIGADEFVIIDTITKTAGGNTDIAIHVYRLPDGGTDADYTGLRVSDLPEDFVPELMATGTARLIKDSLDAIYVSVVYLK